MSVEKVAKAARALNRVLKEARSHLNYCGYGDTWERECAREDKLEEKIDSALRQAKEAGL